MSIGEPVCYKLGIVNNYTDYFLVYFNTTISYVNKILITKGVTAKTKMLQSLKNPYVLECNQRAIDIAFRLLQALPSSSILSIECRVPGGGFKDFYSFVTSVYVSNISGVVTFFPSITKKIDTILKAKKTNDAALNVEINKLKQAMLSNRNTFLGLYKKYKQCLLDASCIPTEPV